MATMSEQPRYGAPSPADGPTTPAADAVSRADVDETAEPTTHTPPAERPTIPDRPAAHPRPRVSPGRTRIGGTWIGLILGAVVLVFLLIFVLQNLDPARVAFLGLEATLPLGIWLLFAAIAGLLLLAIPGLARMMQWRRAGRTGARR